MKRLLIPLLLVLAQGVQADAVNDAFNEGAGYGKGSAGQGTGTLQGDPAATIPDYTKNPPQSGLYGGVQGGDGGIASKGAGALNTDEAGQAALESGTKNPAVTIDPNAVFITTGTNATANADTIADGSFGACSKKVVSKSTFENYTCERDVAVIQTCARTAGIEITGSVETYETEMVLDLQQYEGVKESNGWVRYDVPVPEAVMLSTGTIEFIYKRAPNYHDWGRQSWTFSMYDAEVKTYLNRTADITVAPRRVAKGEIIQIRVRNNNDGHNDAGQDALKKNIAGGEYQYITKLKFPVTAERDSSKSQVVWTESCGFDKTTALSQSGSNCIDPGGERSVTTGGKTYTEHSDCWQYSDSYVTGTESKGSCGALMNDKNCTRATTYCLESGGGVCTHQSETWQCQKNFTSEGMLCGGDYFCQSGDCSDTEGAGDSGFDTAVAKLAALSAAGDDINKDQINIKAFTGQAMSCRKAMAGFSNCCVDSGWGNSVGLANCSDDEMALGKAKEKRLTVSVGEACNKKALGVCIQKKQVYCVFQGKLARIVQEQGRRDQLRVGFGSGDSPDCRGISPGELQRVDFDKINFADFYSDLQNNQNIPNADAMAKQAKDRINAQMSKQGGQ